MGEGVPADREFIQVNDSIRFSWDFVANYQKEYRGVDGVEHSLIDELGDGRWLRLGVEQPKEFGTFITNLTDAFKVMAQFLSEEGHEDIDGVFGESDLFTQASRVAKKLGFTVSEINSRLAYIPR